MHVEALYWCNCTSVLLTATLALCERCAHTLVRRCYGANVLLISRICQTRRTGRWPFTNSNVTTCALDSSCTVRIVLVRNIFTRNEYEYEYRKNVLEYKYDNSIVLVGYFFKIVLECKYVYTTQKKLRVKGIIFVSTVYVFTCVNIILGDTWLFSSG